MRLRHAAPSLLLALALAGCGAAKPLRVRAHAVSVTLDEYRMLPASLSVPAGSLRIVVRNGGLLTHNLALEAPDLDAAGNAVILASTATIMPGASATLVTPALHSGRRYVLASTIGNQAVLGISGTLIVR